MRPAVDAIVLCGGRGRRMGRSKADLPFAGLTLLARVVGQVATEVERVIVVAAAEQSLPELPVGIEVAVVRDTVADLGPLAALATGLAALRPACEAVYATSTDAPFLMRGWVALLAEKLDGYDAAAPCVAGRRHPLAALYRPRAALAAAEELLARGERRLTALLDRLRACDVGGDELRRVDPDLITLCNLNSPADYERALAGLEPGTNDVGE